MPRKKKIKEDKHLIFDRVDLKPYIPIEMSKEVAEYELFMLLKQQPSDSKWRDRLYIRPVYRGAVFVKRGARGKLMNVYTEPAE